MKKIDLKYRNLMSLNSLYQKIKAQFEDNQININAQEYIFNLLNTSILAYDYQKELFNNRLYKDYLDNIARFIDDINKLKKEISSNDNYDKDLYIQRILNDFNAKILGSHKNESWLEKTNLVDKYSFVSKKSETNSENYHDVLFNQNIQEEFKNDLNNIIFYGHKNSGKISQLIYNIDYYNNNNDKYEIKYIVIDNFGSKTETPGCWGFEDSALKNIKDDLTKNKRGNFKKNKYYAIIKNLSYYKNFGNNSEKLNVSTLDYFSRINKYDNEIRFIIVENELGIEALKSNKSFKDYPYWRFIQSSELEDINKIEKAVANKINRLSSFNHINIDIKKEVIEFIKEINKSLYSYNDNIIDLAYKATVDKYFKNAQLQNLKISTEESLSEIINKLVSRLEYVKFQIIKSIEVQKFMWFHSFSETFFKNSIENKFDEYEHFLNKEGKVFEEFKKINEFFYNFKEVFDQLNSINYFNDDLLDANKISFTIDILTNKNIIIFNETKDMYELSDYMLNCLNFILKLIAIYNSSDSELIDSFSFYKIAGNINPFKFNLNLEIENLFDAEMQIIKNNDNWHNEKNRILNMNLEHVKNLYLFTKERHKNDEFDEDNNYYIDIDIRNDDLSINIFNYLLGVEPRLISKSLEKHLYFCLFSNSSIESNLNIEVNKEDFLNFIRKEFNNIVFAFEGKFKTLEYSKMLENIKQLNSFLKENIIGQDKQIDDITKSLANRYIFNEEVKKPWKSFLFVGPTGVGKTRIAQLMGEKLFNNDNFITINMSEYSGPFHKLIDPTGPLTQYISSKPQSIVLFDEIEKSNDENLNILLQILSTGTFVNSNNVEISLKNSIIVCTTNLNSSLFEYERLKENKHLWLETAKLKMKEEILGRFDNIILFNELDGKLFENIFINKLNKTLENIKNNLDILDFELNVIDCKNITNKINSFGFGARSIEAFIQNEILSKISDLILNDEQSLIRKIIINIDKDLSIVGVK